MLCAARSVVRTVSQPFSTRRACALSASTTEADSAPCPSSGFDPSCSLRSASEGKHASRESTAPGSLQEPETSLGL
eukprot:5084431-Pleurochrysis_carterae.AAC.2